MADTHDFERRLERLFDEAPSFADAPLFAAQVQAKLEAKDGVRRAVMGLVGGVGAFIAAVQLLQSNLTGELTRASLASTQAAEQGWVGLTRDAEVLLSGGAAMPGELLWTAAALAALALAALATRVADEF